MGDVDKSLLDRLAALRGSPGGTPQRSPPPISIDTIQRKKTPTREDSLAARLKSLRHDDSPSSTRATPGSTPIRSHTTPSASSTSGHKSPSPSPAAVPSLTKYDEADGEEDMFRTDDDTLQELLGDIGTHPPPVKQDDEEAKVKALLEELSNSIPQDTHDDQETKKGEKEGREGDGESDDDSDGEKMTSEADKVIARLRDEIEIEGKFSPPEEKGIETFSDSSLTLPSVPLDPTSSSTSLPSSPPSKGNTSIDDITARLSALRAASEPPEDLLPSVPSTLPLKGDSKRLKTKTKYTDEDQEGWCTVCLEDATLKCLGCVDEGDDKDGEPYCARCWREMHLGPSAAFDDRGHRAVQFRREKGRAKVALGA